MKTITQNFRKRTAILLIAVGLTFSFVVQATELTFTSWTSGSTDINADYIAMTQPEKDAVTKITFVSSTQTLGNNEIATIASTTNFPNLEVVDLSGVQATSTEFPKVWGTGTFGTPPTFILNSTKLKSISFPSNTTSFPQLAFANCPNLETVVFPTTLTAINQYAFYNCPKLVSINLNNTSLTSILNGAFEKCIAIIEVTLPNTLTTIPARAFYNCSSLQTVTLPNNASITGSNSSTTFGNCGALAKVICKATTPPTTAKIFQGSSYAFKLYVPAASVSDYQASTDATWSLFADANILSIDDLTTVMGVTSESKSVVVYPNPVKSSFSIKNQHNIASVEIVSLAGQVLKSFNQKQSSYSVSDLNKGCYFVRINSKSNPQTVKIIVE